MAVRNRGDQELMRELISPASVKEDAEFLMAPYLNFESFLAPAPMSISVLGQLMLISTETDFDLSKKPPRDGFLHLRHPESFRACLVQVANDGYTAFNKAHTNMDKIRLETLEIPKSLEKALTILFKGSQIEVEDLLPIEIEAMKNNIEDCLDHARETRAEFDKIMLLTAELLECCTSAEGDYQERLREVAIKLDLAEEQKMRLEDEDKNNKEYKEELKKKVDDAEKDYQKALKDMPGGWSLLLTQAVESACNSVSGFLNCFTMGLGMEFLGAAKTTVAVGTMVGQNIPGVAKGAKEVAAAFKKDSSATSSAPQQKQGGKWEIVRQRIDTCQKARKLYDAVTPLYFILINTKEETLNADKIDEDMKVQLQRLEEEYKQVDGNVSDFGNNTLMEWKALCKGWAEAFAECREILRSMDPDRQTMDHIAERMIGLYNRTVKLETQAATTMGDFGMDVQAPMMEQAQAQNPKNEASDKSAKDSAMESARIKLTRTTENLKDLRDNYDKAQERFNNTSKELRQFLAETAQLDMKKVDFEKIRTILRKGIKAFAELRDQWSKLVQFFQMTSSIVEVCLDKSVKKLTKQIEKTSDRYLEGYTVEGLHMDMIYKETFHAAKVAYVVNMVSSSYVQVSKEHIMSRIAGLSKLVSYDPVEDKDAIAQEKRKLDQGVQQTQDKIVELVKKNRHEFYRRTEEKLKTMYQALPPPTPGSKKTEAVIKEGAARGRMTLNAEVDVGGLI